MNAVITPDQFKLNYPTVPESCDRLTILIANIRSLAKNFDKLKECIKTTNHDFSIIGLSETHLKDNPHGYYNLLGYKMEHVKGIRRDVVEK